MAMSEVKDGNIWHQLGSERIERVTGFWVKLCDNLGSTATRRQDLCKPLRLFRR